VASALSPDREGEIQIYDPTNVRTRGLMDKDGKIYPSNQPYAKNLAKALKEFQDKRTSIRSYTQFNGYDIQFLKQANIIAGVDRGYSIRAMTLLKKLP